MKTVASTAELRSETEVVTTNWPSPPIERSPKLPWLTMRMAPPAAPTANSGLRAWTPAVK
jgi:hypothetical protein